MSWWRKNEKPENEPAPTPQTTLYGQPGEAVAQRLVETAPPGWDSIQFTATNRAEGVLGLESETVTAGTRTRFRTEWKVTSEVFRWLEALTAAVEQQWTRLTVPVDTDLSFNANFSYEPLPADVD